MAQSQWQRVCFVQFARWRHWRRNLLSPTVYCCCFVFRALHFVLTIYTWMKDDDSYRMCRSTWAFSMRLSLARLFWNQILTCVSVSPSDCASSQRRGLATYSTRWYSTSSCRVCSALNVVRWRRPTDRCSCCCCCWWWCWWWSRFSPVTPTTSNYP